MYYVCTGNQAVLSDSSVDRLTSLEKALTNLQSLEPLCTDNIAQLAATVDSLIRQQVSFSHADVMVTGKQGKSEHLYSALYSVQTTLKDAGMDHTVQL